MVKTKKEPAYLISKAKVDYYDDKKVYLDLSESSLRDFES
jgi:hypothetical protein